MLQTSTLKRLTPTGFYSNLLSVTNYYNIFIDFMKIRASQFGYKLLHPKFDSCLILCCSYKLGFNSLPQI
jgi:hypothetical protein